MWTTVRNRVEGRLRAIRSMWKPIPVVVDQLQVHRPNEDSHWFDWISRVAQYGIPYASRWLDVEQQLHHLMTDHPEQISAEHADNFMGGVDSFEYIHVNVRGGRFLSSLVDQFTDPRVVEIGTAFGVSGMYLLSMIGEGHLWTFDPCDDWKETAEQNLASIDSRFERIAEPFETGFPRHCHRITPLDVAFVDGLHTYKNVIQEVDLLEPHMNTHSLMILHDIELNDEMKRAWNQIRTSDRVLWSAFVERQFGVLELR